MSSTTVSAPRDANRVPALLGTSNVDGSTPVVIYADPSTHRLLVSSTGGGSGNLVVGTSTITGGTTTRILYDNAGVLGEYPITGTGSVVMSNSPTLVTPTLGDASATTYTATGVISGSSATGDFIYGTLNYSDTNKFATFQTSVNSYAQLIVQNTSNGATASSDLVVNNDVSTGTTFYGDFGMNSSGFTGSGALNAASNVFLTSTSGDLAIGTTTSNAMHFVVNNGATDAVTISSAGATTVTGPVGVSALTVTGGTQTVSFPVLNLTQTWNNAATVFTGVLMNVTNTASNGSSLIQDWQVGAVSKFSVRFDGIALAPTGFLAGTAGVPLTFASGTGVKTLNTGTFSWSNSSNTNGTTDLILSRQGVANLQLGGADAAAPVAQTFSVQSVVTGTSNTAGTNWTDVASLSTGTAVAGTKIINTGFSNTVGTATVTITIATPGVITWTAHGLVTGSPVVFTTTGALPTGITAGTTYYAITTATLGLNTFQIATSPANAQAGTAITTTGSQSGTQTGTTSATVVNPSQTVATFGPSGVTGSQVIPAFAITQNWNTSGVATALKINAVMVNASGAALLADFQRDAVSRASIRQDGLISGSSFSVANVFAAANAAGVTGVNVAPAMTFGWTSGASPFSAADTMLSRSAAAVIQLGNANAASPVAQTLQAQGSRSGTDTNVAGANLTQQSGNGTGNATPSTLILRSPVAVASGTGAQTQTTGLTINVGTAVLTNYAVASLPAAATAGTGATAFVTDASTTIALGLGLTVVGGGANKVPVYSDGTNWIIG